MGLNIQIHISESKVYKDGLHSCIKNIADAAMKIKKDYPEIMLNIEVVVGKI